MAALLYTSPFASKHGSLCLLCAGPVRVNPDSLLCPKLPAEVNGGFGCARNAGAEITSEVLPLSHDQPTETSES